MTRVLLILVTHVLQQVPRSNKVHVYHHSPWLPISLRVVDCHTNRKVAIVAALKALRDMESISRWVPRRVEPNLPIETAGVNNKILAVPPPD